MTWLPKLEQITGHADSPYLTRIVWGRLRLHWFHRGDSDPDPHDHQWDFWTFPLMSYLEERWHSGRDVTPGGGIAWTVRAFRLHHVKAEHVHRVLCRDDERPGPILTIVWTGRKRRDWGFWLEGEWCVWWRYFGMKEPVDDVAHPLFRRLRRPRRPRAV